MNLPHIAFLVMVMALVGGNLIAMTGQGVIGGILALVGVWLITLRTHEQALDLLEKSL
ncbi:MAG: hypothetical protein IH996_03365 [Proteobacteria bacterium]|nr:hypothetical protein [Pseudomonadota bacterium]